MLAIFKDGSTAQDHRLAHTYNGLTLNNPSDSTTSTYRIDSCRSITTYDSVTDQRPSADGMEVYTAYKSYAHKRIQGMILAATYASLFDKIKALAAAFDPALVSHNNPSVQGFLAYDFSVPTTDTTNYASGLVPSRYYARAMSQVEPVITDNEGLGAPFTIDLFLKDPRRYSQSTSSQSGAGTITNIGDYHSWPTITITMAGAGSATYAWTNTTSLNGAQTITLNLSGMVNNDVVVVTPETKTITKNGTNAPQLLVGSWPTAALIEPGSNVITLANTTNATTATVYRRAFCL